MKCLEVLAYLVNSVDRHGPVTEQMEQGVALSGKAETAGQQLDGGGVGAADARHDFLHENFVPGEPLNDRSEEDQMLLGDAIWRPFVHAESLSLRVTNPAPKHWN
jgi:hypothetical protein